MSDEKIKIVSDLVKINKFRSHLKDPDKFFTQAMYTDKSLDDLKKIHDIYTRYLLDYKILKEPYPTVIENLEYTNEKISSCVNEHKLQGK
jgi:hypothetical protein